MMDTATIRAMSRKAARESAARKVQPMVLEQEDIDDAKSGVKSLVNGIPFIGERCPRGWRYVKLDDGHGVCMGYCSGNGAYFVDASGWGSAGDPALTFDEFVEKIKPGLGYAIVEAGQFQVAIAVYEKADGEHS